MGYTGQWLRGAQQVQAHPTRLPEPSQAHGQDVTDQYPQDHQAPPGADYGDADFGRAVVDAEGLALDTPLDSHDSPARSGVYRDQLERQSVQIAGHKGEDRGWVRAAYTAPPFQDDTTRYLEDRWEGGGVTAPSVEAVQRGINSLPQNNDTSIEGYGGRGWRAGFNRWRSVDRKNKIDPRVYTAQQLLAREIRIPQPQPAQNGTWGRTSPFASMARVLPSVSQAPGVFRNPVSLTNSILSEQGADTGDGGIAVDGMWG